MIMNPSKHVPRQTAQAELLQRAQEGLGVQGDYGHLRIVQEADRVHDAYRQAAKQPMVVATTDHSMM